MLQVNGTRAYKYMRYLENGDTKLHDMKNDPFEMHHLSKKPEYSAVCARMEALLQTQDDFEQSRVLISPPQRHRRAAGKIVVKSASSDKECQTVRFVNRKAKGLKFF